MSCYECTHSPVCIYFRAATFIDIEPAFINDYNIEQYLSTVTQALAEVCNLYKSKGENDGQKKSN